MNYILLMLILLVLVFFAYNVFEKDAFSPSVILIVCYFVSCLMAYLATLFNSWNNIINIKFSTLLYIFFGVLFFCIGEFVIRLIIKRKSNSKKINIMTIFNIPKLKIIILYLFVIITGIMMYLNLANLTGEYTNIPKMINDFRNSSLFVSDGEGLKLNFIVMQMYRCIEIIAIILLYIVTKNIILKDSIKNNLKNIILIILISFVTLFISGRSSIVKFVVAFIFFWTILYYKKNKTNINIKKMLKLICICCIIGLPIFYLLLNFLGRQNNFNFFDYVTFYLGNPIPSFQYYLDNFSNKSISGFGQETFVGIQGILTKLNISIQYNLNDHVWVNFGNGLYSNVYTGLKVYFADFGFFGILICQFISGLVFSIIYLFAKLKDNPRFLIFFGMICMYYVDSYRSEKLFNSFISLNTIIYIVYMIIITCFVFDNKKREEDYNE